LLSQMLFHCIAQTGTLTIPFYSVKDLYYLPLLHLNEFLIGNLAGLFFMAHLKDRNKNYLVPILLVFVVLLLALKFPLGLNFHNGLLALLFIPMIFLISLSTDAVTRTFNRPFLVFLGEISYGIYILQAPVWIIFSDSRMLKYFKLDKETDLTLSFFIRLLILIVFASLSYLYFEKPLRNTINQWNKKKIVAS
jgi:peptidoglycan/LPS O-acetylase OafA/YrhL